MIQLALLPWHFQLRLAACLLWLLSPPAELCHIILASAPKLCKLDPPLTFLLREYLYVPSIMFCVLKFSSVHSSARAHECCVPQHISVPRTLWKCAVAEY